MQGRRSLGRGGDTGYRSSCFKLELKAPISTFPHFLNKNILKQEDAANAAKSAEIDRRFKAFKIAKCFLPPSMIGARLKNLVDLI